MSYLLRIYAAIRLGHPPAAVPQLVQIIIDAAKAKKPDAQLVNEVDAWLAN